MGFGSWGVTSSPGGEQKCVSIMTHNQDMATYKNGAYGLLFHITESSGAWRWFQAIKGSGNIVGGPGDGGSHTDPHSRVLAQNAGKDYAWFASQKAGILARYNTVYHIHDYNEFDTSGIPRSAIAGILHYTHGAGQGVPDVFFCTFLTTHVRGGRWPVYVYDQHSLR